MQKVISFAKGAAPTLLLIAGFMVAYNSFPAFRKLLRGQA